MKSKDNRGEKNPKAIVWWIKQPRFYFCQVISYDNTLLISFLSALVLQSLRQYKHCSHPPLALFQVNPIDDRVTPASWFNVSTVVCHIFDVFTL